MAEYDYLIVGAGLWGAVFAHQARLKGKRCLVIDRREHRGGNLYCENVEGINVHRYGAHIFHTSNRAVWEYVNSLVELNRYTNSPIASYRGRLYNLPFNMNTFYRLWGVMTPAVMACNLYTFYANASSRTGEYLLSVREVISERFPETLGTFDRVIFRSNRFSGCNMLLMPRAKFDAYSEWMFAILFEVERRAEAPFVPRVLGFLSEAMLNVWAKHNHLRVCHKTILFIESDEPASKAAFSGRSGTLRRLVGPVRSLWLRAKNELRFAFWADKSLPQCLLPTSR